MKLSRTIRKSEDKSICRIQIWKEILMESIIFKKLIYFSISAVQGILSSWNPALLQSNSKWSVCEVLQCSRQTLAAVRARSSWEHPRGWCCWAHTPQTSLEPLLCHSPRLDTGIRDQYWLKCHFCSRLKSFTLGICKRDQRKPFLPV